MSRHACSEQERRAKAEEARAEAERVLAQQAAELERKKAEMAAREAEREQARQAQVVCQALLHYVIGRQNSGDQVL